MEGREEREGGSDRERMEKSERKSQSQYLKKEQTWLFPGNVLEQLCTNPVIMHIFWKHVKLYGNETGPL